MNPLLNLKVLLKEVEVVFEVDVEVMLEVVELMRAGVACLQKY
jgi:hypothetical protein